MPIRPARHTTDLPRHPTSDSTRERSDARTSVPGDGARVNVQAGEAGDLLLSQSRGIGLLYAQFLSIYRDQTCQTRPGLLTARWRVRTECDVIVHLESVKLDGRELPLTSTEGDQAVVQSLKMHNIKRKTISTIYLFTCELL